MTTPMSRSVLASSNAARISSTVRGVKELRACGRLIVILAIPPDLWYLTSVNSLADATDCQSHAGRIFSEVSVDGLGVELCLCVVMWNSSMLFQSCQRKLKALQGEEHAPHLRSFQLSKWAQDAPRAKRNQHNSRLDHQLPE